MMPSSPGAPAAFAARQESLAAPAPPVKTTVLCVDDEPGILSALKRALRSSDIAVITATSGVQALELMAELPVDLVISDMRMPGMDGAQLLECICHEWPNTVRILMTGYSDTASTVQAVNRGRIFRYLRKPWDEQELIQAVREGLELHRRLKDEARLLGMSAAQEERVRQLNGELQQLQEQHSADRRNADSVRQRHYLQSVKVLTNLLEVRCTGLFEHGRRVAVLARDLARRMELPSEDVLDVFVAGLLHDISLVGLTDEVLAKLDGSGISDFDAAYRDHPALSARALTAMEDMLPVASLVEAHHERFDGTGFPRGIAGAAIPLGARILAFADAVDDLTHGRSGFERCDAATLAQRLAADRGTRFDPDVVDMWRGETRDRAA